MKFTVVNHDWNSTVNDFDSRAEADDKRKSALSSFNLSPDDLEVVKGDYEDYEAYQNRDEENEQANPPHDNHGEPVEQETEGGTQEVDAPVIDHSEPEQPPEDPGTPAAKASDPRNQTPVEPETTNAVEPEQTVQEPQSDKLGEGLAQLGDSIEDDPLDILPGYMITQVDGKPSLNKRGVSVLAYHYGITVKEKTTVVYPHETDFETAVIEIIVEGQDGRVFTGSGEAHVDETPKHQLLRMAETRAYKRAVIFATGTGIVGYQELMGELE